MVSSLERGPRHGAAILASVLLALAISASSGSIAQAAPATLYCAPTNPGFGIVAGEEQDDQQDILPAASGCHDASAPVTADTQSENRQMPASLVEQAPTQEESVWMEVYRAQVNDRVQ